MALFFFSIIPLQTRPLSDPLIPLFDPSHQTLSSLSDPLSFDPSQTRPLSDPTAKPLPQTTAQPPIPLADPRSGHRRILEGQPSSFAPASAVSLSLCTNPLL
ncbi:hypothetical protein Pyn_29410 [Prunus yedoensis var. nudiflora]|uniref:Uncharacterized protein n=1 Tax=Prunus yedoensis var. nudiflora TaxID=2094558 RepID=A0A314ZGP4_PRUYE|nr:hypothetical protein Pyn_29410 [Prunus yedoensis var. nudiflora]